jgi:hypothetical protein
MLRAGSADILPRCRSGRCRAPKLFIEATILKPPASMNAVVEQAGAGRMAQNTNGPDNRKVFRVMSKPRIAGPFGCSAIGGIDIAVAP